MKVGVVGLGVMGRNHARVLTNMPSVDQIVLFDPLGEKLGEIHGVKVKENLEHFLDQQMDYCVVSSPTATHLEIGLKLAARKVPTLIEKPLASSPEEGVELVRAFTDAGVIAGVGHVERFNPAILSMKEKLGNGDIGEIYQISTRRVGPYSGRIRDVGVVKDLASHDIDLAGWLSGSTYESLHSRTLSPMGNKHEDLLMAIATLESGVLVSHLVNWLSPTKERVTSILGERGMLVADTLNVDLFLFEKGSQPTSWDGLSIFKGSTEGSTHKYELHKNEPLVNEHLAFQDALFSGSSKGLASLGDGLRVLHVAERLLQP
jgi:UDP-N-acetylglucosamine 3-dehydrogenase